ncbi:hypothetical protein KO353_07615 [Elioraea tepida]|uniref:Hydantoinase A/oxoprolinase domain-containing protein n=1 Tax=Elioraea tepida TaxID=2843330 RepID=A0A975U6P4_9PROT|nr:hypothetical protein KO353_07615 [Elioraea tepida]
MINAYLLPVVRAYLDRLRNGLASRGVAAPVMLMQSNGGLLAAQQAARLPMTLVESGPAAGVIGARALARRLCLARIVTFDMGGDDREGRDGRGGRGGARGRVPGRRRVILQGSRLLTGGGYTLKVPAIDLAEWARVAARSSRLDPGGAPKVGPRSAGATPGPVCLRPGGTEPTVTDCALTLGWLDPAGLAGGAIRLDPRGGGRRDRGADRPAARPLAGGGGARDDPDRGRDHDAGDPCGLGRALGAIRDASRCSPSAATGRCSAR